MKLSILAPIYNEKETVKQVADKLLKIKLPCEKELVLVDDGSTDGTRSILKAYKTGKKFKIIYHKKNKGKGAAIKTGIKNITGDYLLIQDADLEYNPDEIKYLIKFLLKNRNSAELISVYGTRFKNKDNKMPWMYLLGNRFLTQLTNILYGVKLSDMETGYKLIPVKIIRKMNLKSSHFDFEPEITGKLIKNKVKILEVPITYSGRTHLSGKKLTIMDSFEAVKAIFYYRFFN